MHRLRIVGLLLLLATSCPRKSVVLRLEPAIGVLASADSSVAIEALLARIAGRHGFASSVSLYGAQCTKTWRRPMAGHQPREEAFFCANYGANGPIVVHVYDAVLANHAWTPATDSLRRELIDSLSPRGKLTISDR